MSYMQYSGEHLAVRHPTAHGAITPHEEPCPHTVGVERMSMRGKWSRYPVSAPPGSASLGGASGREQLPQMLPAVEEAGGSWTQVGVVEVAKSPPATPPPGGFQGGGALAQAHQQRSRTTRATGCPSLHLLRHAGGWPPTHATCQATLLPPPPCPTFFQSLGQRRRSLTDQH